MSVDLPAADLVKMVEFLPNAGFVISRPDQMYVSMLGSDGEQQICDDFEQALCDGVPAKVWHRCPLTDKWQLWKETHGTTDEATND